MLTNNQINELITNGYTSVPQLKTDRRKEFVNNIKVVVLQVMFPIL